MRIRPLRDGVVVEILETLTRKETQQKNFMKPEEGTEEIDVTTQVKAVVRAVGPGEHRGGSFSLVPLLISVEDVVLLNPCSSYTIKVEHDGYECVIVDGYEILAVVEE